MDDDPTIPSGLPGSPDELDPASCAPTREFTAGTAAPPTLEEGSTFGPYKVLGLLGSGGMGAVYEVEDSGSGRRVALKVLVAARAGASDHQRFLREGRLAAQLSHPHTVYIYGTEQIEGQPVITMERMSGGTLQDRLKQKGPLPVADAVEATLQVIEGLEAAASLGILHRDVKPSNCFVGEDGTVKVGDFGLSVSTEGAGDTQLTATGTILGTPTYASPEQLQGRKLDLRSDIYAVGATLFYLLTGKAPFQGDNVVTLIAAILQETPPSPRDQRPDIPPRLARVIVRCLGKKPSDRFTTYRDLATALFPFSKKAYVPAPPGRRFLAYLLDLLVMSIPSFVMGTVIGASGGVADLPVNLVIVGDAIVMGIAMTYLLLFEGLGGFTLGKLAAGLRVVGPGNAVPGLRRALGRVGFFYLGGATAMTLRDVWLVTTDGRPTDPVAFGIGSISLLWLFGLFATARARNGFSAFHDRISGTRVVRKVDYQGQQVAQAPDRQEPELGETVGPFRLLAGEKPSPRAAQVGWDAALCRPVWIRVVPGDAAPVSSARQDLNRSTRLRWLDGRRSGEEGWDAYERPEGSAFLTLAETRQPWRRVRRWLVDLAEELACAGEDGTLPESVGLEHLWIASDDRLKIADFPVETVPEDAGTSASFAADGDIRQGRAFLSHVAIAALEGRTAFSGEPPELPSVPLPLGARVFLSKLRSGTSGGWPALIAELRELTGWREAASRRTWLLYASVLFTPVGIMLLLVGLGILLGPLVTGEERRVSLIDALVISLAFAALVLALEALLAVTLALVTRGGLMLRAFGLTVVGRDGAPASRLRCAVRSVIAWSPGLAVLLGITLAFLATKPAPLPWVGDVWHEGSPALGLEEARVTLDAYIDYQDTASADLWGHLEPLLDEFPEDLRIVFKQVPLSGDLPARAALEAHAQGRFGEMHSGLVSLGDGMGRKAVLELGRGLGLDMIRFETHLGDKLHDPVIERDTQEFVDSGCLNLPLVLVNGRRHVRSLDRSRLSQRVTEEIRWLEGGPPPHEFGAVYRFSRRYGGAIRRSRLELLGTGALLLLGLGGAWLVWKGRGVQDLLAGTHIVPR